MPQHVARMNRRQAPSALHVGKIHPAGVEVLAGNQLCRVAMSVLPVRGGSLVVVHNLDLMGAILTPDEDDAPLAVDPDRMLASPVASQCLQPVAGGRRRSSNRSAASIAASFRRAAMAKIPRHAARQFAGEDARGGFVAEAPDHDCT